LLFVVIVVRPVFDQLVEKCSPYLNLLLRIQYQQRLEHWTSVSDRRDNLVETGTQVIIGTVGNRSLEKASR
jgi:hypothetical protein